MRINSTKEFLQDLLKVLFTTADGAATLLVMLFFQLRPLFDDARDENFLRHELEGILFSIVALLMLIRLRINTPVEKKIHWGAATSVLALFVCITTLR